MNAMELKHDPFNIIITGVGGQGNVTASRMLGNILIKKGYYVTIGETFGASQRGGSVMSHMRISKKSTWSPQIPQAGAHLVVALEPIEAIRVMVNYGNTDVRVLANTRPIYPVQVIAGDLSYPSMDEIEDSLSQLAGKTTFVNATDKAVEMGNPILGNIIMLGAAVGTGMLPVTLDEFREAMSSKMTGEILDLNVKAFETGIGMTN